MFWLPVVFIMVELFTTPLIREFVRYSWCQKLYELHKSDDIKEYIDKKYGKKYIGAFTIVYLLYHLAIIIYAIIGLFYSIWPFSILYISWTLWSDIGGASKKKKIYPIEECIQKAKLENFKSDNQKLIRYLKLQTLENLDNDSDKKIKPYREWKIYIFTLVKIATFAAIIILHYNFKII